MNSSSSSSCLLDTPLAGISLMGMAMALGMTALCLATILSGTPLQELGQRPKGYGLWTWLLGYFVNGTGIYGYDAIQGALAPPLRLQCHMAAVLFLWGMTLCLISQFDADLMLEELLQKSLQDSSMVACYYSLPMVVWLVGALSTGFYLFLCFMVHHVMDGVSMPGGPRKFKIQRQPQWKDQQTCAPNANRWSCLVAEASHDCTHDNFPGQSLTGEPAGRQIWTSTTTGTATEQEEEGVLVDSFTTPQKKKPEKQEEEEEENLFIKLWNQFTPMKEPQPPPAKESQPATPLKTVGEVDEELVKIMAQGGREEFGFNASKNPNSCDMVFRAQQIRKYLASGKAAPDMDQTPETVPAATKKAAHFYSMLQCEDGHWAADYGGPHFLMPGMITAWYVMGKPKTFLNDDQIDLLKHYILVHQQADGGWGTHLESPSTMFGSTLMYVALRLLGQDQEDPACIAGRKFLQDNGGALYTSSWSKFYLCLLGCMDWKGHNSVPPEMWMLPNWFPFHPGRMWCHARMVYLPMGYLYGHRFVYEKAESDPLIQSLRQELYCEPYDSISWIETRHWVAPMDNYSPIPWVMKTLQNVLARYENWAIFQPFKDAVRRAGLTFSLEYMKAEDLQTNFIDIGPVNKVLNMISMYHASGGDINDPSVVKHMMRVPDYLWVAEDGMKMQGYNGSQCWDTSFCAQALFEANLLDELPDVSRKIWNYLERTQILSTEVSRSSPAYQYESNQYRNKFYRHVSEGGWPFSMSAHGWPISDCTSEGLKATLCLLKTKTIQSGLSDESLRKISDERLYKAVNQLLTYQNEDGGWATYENNRGWGWYEQLNPSEVFGDIMIDYSYVECSMATLTALVDFHEVYPDHRTDEVMHSIEKGCAFLKSIQRADGSWYGSWACCFCYGIWFGVEGLMKCGEPVDSPSIRKACEFLLKHQRPNGGWGEDFTSCYDKDYAKEGMEAYGDDGSGIVNTAWALLALSIAKCQDVDAIREGVQYLMKRQLPTGDWPQEGIAGVFNRSVGISYTAYRNVFPIWAMGRCYEVYGDELDQKEAAKSKSA